MSGQVLRPPRVVALGAAAVVLVGAALVLAGPPRAAAQDAVSSTDRVSLSDTGAQADFDSTEPAVSADGRYVVFTTAAPLDPLDGDDADRDVYLRDRRTGHTVLLSRGQVTLTALRAPLALTPRARNFAVIGETGANGDSYHPVISATGRYVAFETTATNFATGDTDPAPDVVLLDRDPDGDGVLDERLPDGGIDYDYVRVGRRVVDGHDAQTAYNTDPSVSADGRTVAVVQHPVPPSSPPTSLRAEDRPIDGTVGYTVLRTDAAGRLRQPANGDVVDVDRGPAGYDVLGSAEPAVSADGRHLAVVGRVREQTTDGTTAPEQRALLDVSVPDRVASRIDQAADRSPLPGVVDAPTVSGDGRTVAFTVTDPSSAAPQVVAVDRDPDGNGVLSADGNTEPFTTRVVSLDTGGAPGGGLAPALSADGRYLAFVTGGRAMHDGVDYRGDFGGCVEPGGTSVCDVVVRDLVTDRERAAAGLTRLPADLASASTFTGCGAAGVPARCEADQDSGEPALSATGDLVVYGSGAEDLVTGDTNDVPDVFAHQYRPTMAAAPSTVDFDGVVLGGDRTAAVTVQHVGFGPRPVGGVRIDGPDAGDFTVFPAETCSGRTFHVTGSCAVSVRFTPSATGTRSATLHVDGPDGAPLTAVALDGGGQPVVRAADVDHDTLVFPAGLVLSPAPPQAVVVHNSGTVGLTVTAVAALADTGTPRTMHPEDYAVTADTCTGRVVAAGGSCAFTVTATPHGTGVRSAVLAVTSDADSGPTLIELTAAGAVPALTVNPAVVRDSQATAVRGVNFPARQLVLLAGPGGDTPVVTDARGGFSAPFVVLPNSARGSVPLRTTFDGVTPPVGAVTAILVVPGSAAPPDFTERR